MRGRDRRLELSDVTPKSNKAIIELYKNKPSIKENKIGTLNYIVDEEKMYITKKSKRQDAESPGEFMEVLTKDIDNISKGDLILNGDLKVKGLTVLGDYNTKEFEELKISRPMLELNSNEVGKGITLVRSGVNINRGTEGNANIMYDETEDGFVLSLEKGLVDISNTEIEKNTADLIATDNKQVFKSPIIMSRDYVNLIFLNSIKILEDHEYKIDYENQTVEILEDINKGTELSIITFKINQYGLQNEPINEKETGLKKYVYSTGVLKETEDSFVMGFKDPENKESAEDIDLKGKLVMAFLNGVFLHPKYYTISVNNGTQNIFKFNSDVDGKAVKIRKNSQLYLIAISPIYDSSKHRVLMGIERQKIATPEVGTIKIKEIRNEYDLPIHIGPNSSALVFVNSVLLDINDYHIKDDKLKLLNIELNVGSIIEVVKLEAFTVSPVLDYVDAISEKEYDKLMTVTKNKELITRKATLDELKVKDSADITDLTVRQSEGNKYGLNVLGKLRSKGMFIADHLSMFNDDVINNGRIVNNEEVKHNDYAIHGKPYLFLNDNLEQDDGGIKLERENAPHAIIEWRENVKRWFAGIEGTERPIVTLDMLELIIERLMDLAGIDYDVHTSIKTKQMTHKVSSYLTPEESYFFTYDKRKDHVLLVFINGRYVSEDEYTHVGNRVIFNKYINRGSILNFVDISLDQHSLTGYPIKEELALNKKYIKINATKEGQNEFLTPFNMSEYENANMLFLNGIMLTPDLYEIKGNILRTTFDCSLPSEIVIVSLDVVKGGTVSKVELMNNPLRVHASTYSQKVFVLPRRIRKEKDNFLVFCNTTFISEDMYEIDDRYLILKDIEKNFVNPPTEIYISEFVPVSKRCSGPVGGSLGNSRARNYEVEVEKGRSIVSIPYMVDKDNPTLIVFLDGKILNRDEYQTHGDRIELITPPQENATLKILDFVSEDYIYKADTSNQGTRIYEEKHIGNKIDLPFVIEGKNDTNLIFSDGVLIDEKYYKIDKNSVLVHNKYRDTMIKIINFSDVRSINYDNKALESKEFIKTFEDKSLTWKVEHNMNTYPNIIVIDKNNEVIKDMRAIYDDTNNITIKFNKSMSGKVILK